MIIVGLGNIGKEYENTRHNAGFIVIDALADKLGVKFKDKECRAVTASLYKNGGRVVLAKPQTYMNLSGESVRELAGKYGEQASGIIVIYDDIDIPSGAIRVRREGSGGTHNGMRNVIECMKTKEIPRIRVGIGKPDTPIPLADYVLGRIDKETMDKLTENAAVITDALIAYISDGDIDTLIRKCNR